MAVLDNGLAINDCRLAAEVGGGTDDRGIAVAPVISVASEDTGFSSLNQHLGAIAIVFDFVNPVLALWWLINQGGKLGLDEPEPCRKHYFVLLGSLTEEAPDGEGQSFAETVGPLPRVRLKSPETTYPFRGMGQDMVAVGLSAD